MVKNIAQGGYKFAKNLPSQTKKLLQENKGIRNLLSAKYLEWKTLTTNIDNLTDAERKIINEQQKVWKTFGVVGKLVDVVYRNIKYEDFIKTFTATEGQYKKAYQLWGEEKWDELYQYFKINNLNGGWPPFEGFVKITKTETGNELAGKVFDRFQGPGDISGKFASPVYGNQGIDDLYFTYDSRALKYDIGKNTNYV